MIGKDETVNKLELALFLQGHVGSIGEKAKRAASDEQLKLLNAQAVTVLAVLRFVLGDTEYEKVAQAAREEIFQ